MPPGQQGSQRPVARGGMVALDGLWQALVHGCGHGRSVNGHDPHAGPKPRTLRSRPGAHRHDHRLAPPMLRPEVGAARHQPRRTAGVYTQMRVVIAQVLEKFLEQADESGVVTDHGRSGAQHATRPLPVDDLVIEVCVGVAYERPSCVEVLGVCVRRQPLRRSRWSCRIATGD